MLLSTVNIAFDHKITGGSDYQWSCYGADSRHMDYESEFADATVVFDGKNQEIYEAVVYPKSEDMPAPYRWINPEYLAAYKRECHKKQVDPYRAWDDVKWFDLELESDWLEKAQAIFNNLPFDRRIQVPLDLEDDLVLQLALAAHKRDVTLNKMVEIILKNIIDQKEGE